MCPLCKDDLVYLPRNVQTKLGGVPPIMLVSKVTTAIHLVDPYTGRTTEVQGTEYWKYPFEAICSRKHLTEFTVLNVEQENGKIWNVEMARSQDLGFNDNRVIVRSHLGGQLKPGDLCHCYDMSRLNLSGSNDDIIDQDNLDIIIVKRAYHSKKNKKRNWTLKRLKKEKGEDDNDETEDRDMEDFQYDIETNPELRKDMNLYKKPVKGGLTAIAEDEEDHGSEPDVDLAELLDEMTLNENEETYL